VLFIIIVMVYGTLGAIFTIKIDTWRHEKAEEYLSQAINSPDNTEKLLLSEKAALLLANEETYLFAGVTALNFGDNNLAQKYLGRVKTAEGYAQLAGAYYNLERYDLAISAYIKALAIRTTSAGYLGVGRSYLKTGDLERAQTAFAQASELQPAPETQGLYILAGGTLRTGEAAPLDETLLNVSRETSESNKAVLRYNELNKLGYPQSANKVIQSAYEQGQAGRDTLFMLAEERFNVGDNQAAYDLLIRAKTIDPYYPQIYNQLAIVSEKLGKTNESKQYQAYYSSLTF